MAKNTWGKLRIAHVIGSASGGGAETQLSLIAREQEQMGVESRVFCVSLGPAPKFSSGTSVHLLRKRPKWRLLARAQDVAMALADHKPDLVHAWLPEVVSLPATIWGRRHRIPVVSAHRNRIHHDIGSHPRNALLLIQHRAADCVVANFDPRVEPWYFRCLSRGRVYVIPNAISGNGGEPIAFPNRVMRVITCGRMVPQKGFHKLLAAVQILHARGMPVELIIFGGGSANAEAALLETAKKLRLEKWVRLKGFVADWSLTLASGDVFVLASEFEGMPNVLFEALARGVPCIASGVESILHLDGIGRAVKILSGNDPAQLADAVGGMIKEGDRSQHAAAVVEQLDVARMAAAYRDLYEGLIGEGGVE